MRSLEAPEPTNRIYCRYLDIVLLVLRLIAVVFHELSLVLLLLLLLFLHVLLCSFRCPTTACPLLNGRTRGIFLEPPMGPSHLGMKEKQPRRFWLRLTSQMVSPFPCDAKLFSGLPGRSLPLELEVSVSLEKRHILLGGCRCCHPRSCSCCRHCSCRS